MSFSRQVLPVLQKECRACHAGAAAPGGYSMETAAKLVAGGRHGAAIVPGKSTESMLLRYLTGQQQPQMPPGKPLSMETVALIRKWIDEGAKIDRMQLPGTARPAVAPTPAPPAFTAAPAPVTALAFAGDGKLLAAGGYQAVRLIDPATGAVTRTLAGPSDQVLAVAWSPDGKWLAAGGGEPGTFGELCLWDTSTWAKPRVFKAHADTIYGIAWRPGVPEAATASLDKTVTLWNTTTWTTLRTLKDHADAVYGVAYSPDGKWLATCSVDRSAKLYQLPADAKPPAGGAAQPERLRPTASLSHGEAVSALAFSPKSDLLATACHDKQVRVWPVKVGPIDNPTRSQSEGDLILSVAFSRDGSTFGWGAANHKVKLWNGDVTTQKRDWDAGPDWVYALDLSPDGKLIAAGGGDGRLYLWSEPEGKPTHTLTLGPASTVATAKP